jgi:dolichyl-phosphate-mannose-protein mannosyltransferase/protein-O-mannosyltransferase-like protein
MRPSGSAFLNIGALLLGGLLLRLVIAYVFFPNSGFESDLGTFKAWALQLAQDGPGEFYTAASFADYPPGFMYVLLALGSVSSLLASVLGSNAQDVVSALVKVPGILADLGIGYLIYRLVRGWVPDRDRGERLALLAASLFVFNPVVWYDSALWGQVDAVGTLVMLAAVAVLLAGYSEGATGLMVLAGLMKPQFGLVLLPVVAVVLIRRHLLRPGSGPRPSWMPARLRDWFVEEQGPWRLVSSAAVGLVALLLTITPFSLDVVRLVVLLGSTAGGYPWLSVNAYNPWALIGAGGSAPLAAAGGWSRDDVPLLGPIPGVVIGSLLLLGGFIAGAIQLARRDSRWAIVGATIFFALAFFVLPTRVHERYLFPVFALLPLVAVADRRWLFATVGLSIASFINLHAVLTTPLYGTPNVDNLVLGEAFRTFPWILLSIAGHVAVLVFIVRELLRGTDPLAYLSAPAAALPGAAERVATGVPLASGLAELEASPGLAMTIGTRLLNPVRRRLAVRSIRADLSRTLHWEPPGRIDRLDLVIAGLLIVAALTIRTWRLEQPYEMHFDEVYHARTATEFLQDWRYGMPHDIYEYTHPHLAKYLIAAGIVAFGNDRVTGQSDLKGPVASAAIEPRWSPLENLGQRDGDRLYVSTGTAVRVYDLRDRNLVAQFNSPAVALAVDTEKHVLYMASADGTLSAVQTPGLDLLRSGATGIPTPRPIRQVDGTPQRLVVTDDGQSVIAGLPGGRLVAVSTETGELTGSASIAGAAGIVTVNDIDAVVADPASMTNEQQAAARLAGALSDDESRIQKLLAGSRAPIVISAFLTDERRNAVQKAIDAGELPGVDIEPQAAVAVANDAGVAILDGASLQRLGSASIGKATGLALMAEGLDKPTLYVAVGSSLQLVEISSSAAPRGSGSVKMPGPVTDVLWDASTGLVHALGQAPAKGSSGLAASPGSAEPSRASGTPTIYVVEPHGNAVFADARLPFSPYAWLMDKEPERPADDRQAILVLSQGGQLATVDVGSNAFAWRFPGVIAGALLAGCLYLLGRLLFRRRSVAVIAALLVLVDGMFFANARIAMNDTYVAFFIVAALTVFALLYMEHWRGRSALLIGIPLVGLLLGFALAAKWVGAYAIGAVLLLVLLRSALGRLLALAGMIGLSGLLGYLAIAVPADAENPQRNVLFLVLLVALTVLLAIAIVIRPVRMTPAEHRYAFVAMFGAGALMALVGLLLRASLPGDGLLTFRNLLVLGTLLMLSGVGTLVAPRIGEQLGFRPFGAPAPGEFVDPPSPAPSGWLSAGWSRGIPWTWALAALAVIPLVVYVISYVPWAMPWHATGPRLADGWPLIGTWPPGHGGQTFLDLQKGMYDYHNNLRATHAASSPWWAWPLDLKPVWFYSQGFGEGGTGLIYDAGNMVAFWLAIPAMAWVAWQAWMRRSLALTFLVITVAALWLPWARIDRATFQYHIFTSLPFTFLALGYFLAELWHGPSRRTWALARLAGAGALILPAVMWLTRPVLCGLAATEKVRPGGQACGSVTEQFVLSERWAVALVLALIGLAAVIWQWRSLRDAPVDDPRSETGLARRWLALTALASLAAVAFALLGLSERPVLAFTIGDRSPYLVALVALVVLAIPALFILEARDPRRFVVVAVGAAALWFLAFYPYLSGLPVPSGIAAWYQTLPLPTWNYDFQFAVNVDPPFRAEALLPSSLGFAAGVGSLCVAAMYAANSWRLELARRRYERAAEATEAAEA